MNAATEAGDEQAEANALTRFTEAINDLTKRSGLASTPEIPPPPPPLDAFELQALPDDDLEQLWGQRTTDPDGQALIEREWSRRDHQKRGPGESGISALRHSYLVDALHEPEAISDLELKVVWLDCHTDPELRVLAESEMDRRMLTHTEHPGEDPDLEDEVSDRLEYAWSSMSPTEYRRYEATLVTDPAARMPENAAGRRKTVQELQTEYGEYCYERYLEAEAATRGHLLNRRGRHLNVDPMSLMSGNAKRMHAYASDEFKGFIGATGGHMSFARFKAVKTTGDYSAAYVEGFADAVSL